MKMFHVEWSVKEHINGPGKHDDHVRDGDVNTVAEGKVDKEGESADALRAELTALLKSSYPEHGLGPTYDIDRTYHIEITET